MKALDDQRKFLQKLGPSVPADVLLTTRRVLREETALEGAAQGRGDTEIMALCCEQLFYAGNVDDVLDIWRAKAASLDASSAIAIQLLCGAGLEQTKDYLHKHAADATAAAALAALERSERSGDFRNFSVPDYKRVLLEYFEGSGSGE